MAATTAGIPDSDDNHGLGKLDKRITDALGKLSSSDLVILRWHLRRRDAQTCPDPIPTVWWLLGGRGCVAAGTPVWDPLKMEYRPIEDMVEPSWVLSTQGPVIASPSYIKGVAPLFRLETERGDVILATGEHRFLTKRGYIQLQEIASDDEIVSLDPLRLLLGEPHSWETVANSQFDCDQGPRQYDQRPLQVAVSAQGTLPSRAGVPERSQQLFCLDDSKPSPGGNHAYLEPGRRSRRRSSPAEHLLEVDRLPLQLLADEQFQQRLLAAAQFLHMTYPQTDPIEYEGQFGETLRCADGVPQFSCCRAEGALSQQSSALESWSESRIALQVLLDLDRLNTSRSRPQAADVSDNPSLAFVPSTPLGDWKQFDYMDYTTGERVRSVEAAGTQVFYDLHVPGPNNYLASGMFHSNSGKTYSAANHIFEYSATLPFTAENETVYVALIGSVFDDVKNTIVEGQSGLLKLIPEEDLLKWNRTVGELSWRVVGPEGKQRVVRCNAYTSEKPDKLRGPNIHLAWIDEYAKFKDADIDPTKAGTTWQNMMLGLRLGTKPHVIVTGTPTDCRLSKYLLAHPAMKMSLMTTIDNRDNLPESFYDEIMLMDPTSRTYRQEVLAELIFDNPDAIFTTENIERGRADIPEDAEIVYKVLGYDPSVSSAADADECGIVLSAYTPEVKEKSRDQGGRPRIVTPTHAYVLKDLSGHYTPHEQTQLVVQTMLNEAVDDLIFEQNQGVEFVMTALEQALKDNVLEYKIRRQSKAKKTDFGIVKRWVVSGVKIDGMPFKFMIYAVHATSQKKLRAEMVSTRYDSGQIHHPTRDNPLATCEVANCRANLESQMTSWDPKSSRYSPDRLDAMAYCMLHIFANFMITRSKVTIARPVAVTQGESQHQAVRPRRKGLVGLYSMDFEPGPLADTAERALIPGLERRYDPNPYI